MSSPHIRDRSVLRWARFGLAVSVILMLSKLGLYAYTSSLAVLSDALESVVNIATSAFTLFAIWLANTPRDADHPYGHGKVEYLAELAEGIAIGVAGAAILLVTATSAGEPQHVDGGWVGVGLTALVAGISLSCGEVIRRAGGKHSSASLAADGEHIRADGITTIGTFVALALVRATGWVWIDAAVAVGIGLWLCFSALRLIRSSSAGLMDEANPELLDEIGAFLQEVREPGWLAPHETRIHRLGEKIHVDMHMVFPRFWTLEKTHDVASHLEHSLAERFQGAADLMLHMEPCKPFSCLYCDLPDCPVRTEPKSEDPVWTGDYIAAHYRHGSEFDPNVVRASRN